MILQELLDGLREPPTAFEGDTNVAIGSLATDSRSVEPGALFFALPGTRTDGRRYVAQAIDRGAVAVAAPDLPEPLSGVARLAFAAIDRSISEIASAPPFFAARAA